MSELKSEKKKKNVNKSLSEKEIYRLYDSLLRNKNARQNWRALIYILLFVSLSYSFLGI